MPRKPVGICNESVAVACEESVHGVAEQNQRLGCLRLSRSVGVLARCAFALRQKLGICSTQGRSSKWCKKKNHSAGGQVESNCPFAYIELWEKVQLPMQSMH